jgi:hypothetical protein
VKNLFNRLFKKGENAEQRKSKKVKGVLAASMAAAALTAIPTSVGAAPIDFSTQKIGVDVPDVVGTGFSFMGMFDTYTLLVLGAIFAPVAIGFVIWIMRKMPKFGGGKS